jgi:hypothetical protein
MAQPLLLVDHDPQNAEVRVAARKDDDNGLGVAATMVGSRPPVAQQTLENQVDSATGPLSQPDSFHDVGQKGVPWTRLDDQSDWR